MKIILLATLSLIFSANVFGFGQTGHRITGKIAESYLSENTKRHLKELLGNESLAEASTFVDEMKSNPAEFWQKTANAYHYITIPEGKTYREVGAPKKSDALQALKKYSSIIKSADSSKKEKTLAIKFIIHIIGDLHQPLHVGNGTDRGGNDVKVKFFYSKSNLHRVWDSEMINNKQLSFTEWSLWLGRSISEGQVTKWSSADPMVWVKESKKLRENLYPKSADIKYQYLYNNIPIVKQRLKQAGVRIAVYLNQLFE